MAQIRPYGTWTSPITADLIVAEAVRLGQVCLDGDTVYWAESRPSEKGRTVLVGWGGMEEGVDVTPEPFRVRSRVHEYGGGAYTVWNGRVFFVDDEDQQLYRQAPGEAPVRMTDASGMRFSDPIVDADRGRLVCVREDHGPDREPENVLVGVGLQDQGAVETLVEGNDFYASPGLSRDGQWLSWLSWNHPNMPWDGTELWVGRPDESGQLQDRVRVAGGGEESIFQPSWGPDGQLYFVSDQSGWWNLYRWDGDRVTHLVDMEAEFGMPQWVFGMSTYGFSSDHELVCTYTRGGAWEMGVMDLSSLALRPVLLPYTDLSQVRAGDEKVVFLGGSPNTVSSLVQLDLKTGEQRVLRTSCDVAVDPAFFSIPEAVSFPTEDGETAHGFFYPPCNRDYRGAEAERPPLLVVIHGGPTGATTNTLDLNVQYWTSRGFALLDVNYGGSTGYGRAYRGRLDGRWGVVDVDDCVNGARFLAGQGRADGDRLLIRGGSAGGYTTLCVLTIRDVFCAGASYYGVSDLEALTMETHKFESRYLDRLIGPYPDRQHLYRDRSPIYAVDRLSAPVIFFQGDEDRVVPPEQAEEMVRALEEKHIPVAYVLFEGEHHGFRQAAHMKQALEGEFYFYSRVLGFRPAEHLPEVPIRNL